MEPGALARKEARQQCGYSISLAGEGRCILISHIAKVGGNLKKSFQLTQGTTGNVKELDELFGSAARRSLRKIRAGMDTAALRI